MKKSSSVISESWAPSQYGSNVYNRSKKYSWKTFTVAQKSVKAVFCLEYYHDIWYDYAYSFQCTVLEHVHAIRTFIDYFRAQTKKIAGKYKL